MQKIRKFSSPGRICLFGEHQDYLGLPVIAAAISKRISISGAKREDNKVNILLPDIHSEESFTINSDELVYSKKADYFKSGVNILRKQGLNFSKGFDCTVKGNIPIRSGTSSSSAMVVTWINFLTKMANEPVQYSPEQIGQLAYEAEVFEFNEAGGMMDQFSTAFGGVIFLSPFNKIKVEKLNPNLGSFVLGDSLEPKDTQEILKRVKRDQREAIEEFELIDEFFDLHHIKWEEVAGYKRFVSPDYIYMMEATVMNRMITERARDLLKKEKSDRREIGELLNELQETLRKKLRISTPKIDRMVEASLKAGAYGAKINGSGGGGCMFAYAPENPEAVADAIEREGGKAYIIDIDEGTREEQPDE